MRFDLPHEPEITRRRDSEVSKGQTEPAQPAPPISLVDENLSRLQRPVEEIPAHLTRPQESDKAPVREIRQRRHTPQNRPRRTREGVAVEVAGIRIRPEEKRLLREAGRFRVIAVKDIAHSIYGGDERAMRTDLNFLEKRGMIAVDSVPPRNDGRWRSDPRIEIVTLTRAGEKLLHATGELSPQQLAYHGLVKPREAEHDSQIYRAYLKEAEHIANAGGTNLRVELDFELKSKVQKAIYAAQKAEPSRSMDEIKREVAAQHELPFVRDKIEIPDARIHYDVNDPELGSRAAFSDVEVVTAAYRPAHMRAKTQAGFRMYANASDRSRLGRIEDEQHMLDWVMEL
jgi:hypothetical protein